ncbi:MAG: hypothetical protein H6Q89_3556 [Myxococcaceae bacterium]|nr:hypothetical protein [Myxococcaceae bacterium]
MSSEPRFVVDAKGGLTPVGPGTSTLQPQSLWSLANTSPDWMVFLRNPSIGGVVQSRPRVVMAGDCGAFPLSDLIAFLGQSRWTGLLKLQSVEAERQLGLKEGEVRWAHSDAHAERIGEVMVRLGYVTRPQLEGVLNDTPPSRVGRALVEKNLMQAHDLWKCVTEQVSEIFHAMMLCKEGAFTAIDEELDDKSVHNLNISMQSLLMDSIRKIDEMAHFRKKIPTPRVHVGKKRPSDGKLEPEEDQVLALLDGHKTVFELGQAARMSEFDITRVVYRLLEGGFAQVSTHPIASAPQAAPPVASAPAHAPAPSATASDSGWKPPSSDETKVLNVFNFIFREVRNEVARRGKLEDFMQSANAALSSGTLSPSPMLSGIQFQPDGSLPEKAVLEAYRRHAPSLGSEPVASFKQALSDVMFFLLFQAGELLESRADEDLARRVKELLATLEIQ